MTLAAAAAAIAMAAPASAQLPVLPIPTVVPTVIPGLPGVPGVTPSGPAPAPYQAADGKGFRDVLPPGTRGRYDAAELGAFLATGQNVPHCCDQLAMYRDLMYATPGLRAAEIGDYYKASSFGVRTARPSGRTPRAPT